MTSQVVRVPLVLSAAVLLAACVDDPAGPRRSGTGNPGARDSTPTSASTTMRNGWLIAYVVDSTGVCLAGGTVRIVAGQRVGEYSTQNTPCDAWGYDGFAEFRGLVVGSEITVEASAPGFHPERRKMMPTGGPQTAHFFELAPLR